MNACDHGREPVGCDLCRARLSQLEVQRLEQLAVAYYSRDLMVELERQMRWVYDFEPPFYVRHRAPLATIDPAFTATLVTAEDEDA